MRREIVQFTGAAASQANKTLVSKRINSPYRIKKIRVAFDANCNNTVNIYPFISFDAEAPTAAAPAGQNILAEFGQADYFNGDGDVFDIDLDHEVEKQGTYLKMYITNSAESTPYVHVQVAIEIEE